MLTPSPATRRLFEFCLLVLVALPAVGAGPPSRTKRGLLDGVATEAPARKALDADDDLELSDVNKPFEGPLADAATGGFQRYVVEHRLDETMTEEELSRFKERFMAKASKKGASADISLGGNDWSNWWNRQMTELLGAQMPAITKRIVDAANRHGGASWVADMADWAKDLPMADAKTLMGYIADPDLQDTPLVEDPWAHNADVAGDDDELSAARRLGDSSKFPKKFDAREKWPECSAVIGHVRDQGKCGSCWAQAAAGSLDARLCIASGAVFSGDGAWVSAGYITSCYNMIIINGCNGGNPGWALSNTKRGFFGGGAPTRNCVPYFGSGDSLAHFDSQGNMQAPTCPSTCNQGYPRSLMQDLLYSTGSVVKTDDIYQATWLTYTGGSIAMAFTVMKDFMAYKSGFYEPTTDEEMGGHATTMIGWDTHDGNIFVQSVNSWGERWGDKGLFKITSKCCKMSFFIPSVSGSQRNLPLPGGPSTGNTHWSDYGVPPVANDMVSPLDNTVELVVQVDGLACKSLQAQDKESLQKTVADSIEGRFPYKLGVLRDVKGLNDRVSILPCAAPQENGTAAIEWKKASDYLARRCSFGLGAGTTSFAFGISTQGQQAEVDALNKTLHSKDFGSAVLAGIGAAGLGDASGAAGAALQVGQVCISVNGDMITAANGQLYGTEAYSPAAFPVWAYALLGLLVVGSVACLAVVFLWPDIATTPKLKRAARVSKVQPKESAPRNVVEAPLVWRDPQAAPATQLVTQGNPPSPVPGTYAYAQLVPTPNAGLPMLQA